MELKLQQLIDSLRILSKNHGLSANNPVVTRLSKPSVRTLTVIVIAIEEPHTLVLPLNVTWVCLNPSSIYFTKALIRLSKASSSEFTHTWREIHHYEDIFVDQIYDNADISIINATNTATNATTTQPGLVKLSQGATNNLSPVAVETNDPRMSDARPPLPHTHPQQPATSLATNGTNVIINTSNQPEIGSVLVAVSETEAVWRKLTDSDIQD